MQKMKKGKSKSVEELSYVRFYEIGVGFLEASIIKALFVNIYD